MWPVLLDGPGGDGLADLPREGSTHGLGLPAGVRGLDSPVSLQVGLGTGQPGPKPAAQALEATAFGKATHFRCHSHRWRGCPVGFMQEVSKQ